MQLFGFQEAAADGLRDNVRAGVVNQILCSPTGSGKCLAPGTPIVMADGTVKLVEHVTVGDRLLGPDGEARTVRRLGRGRAPMFRVTPTKGDPFVCNGDHLLALRSTAAHGLTLADGTRVEPRGSVNISVDTWLASGPTVKHCLKGWRPAEIEFPDAGWSDRPVPPYLLGAWLGDGAATLATLYKPECEMTREWVRWCETSGAMVRVGDADRCPGWRASGGPGSTGTKPLRALREIGVLGNKHIPHAYLTAPASDRLDLLAGLLDSDGHYARGHFDWISCSKLLAEQFAFVARSLGFACYINECKKGIRSTGFEGTYWRCSLSGHLDRIPTRDKRGDARRQKKDPLVTGISVEPVGMGDYLGFTLDGDGLFLLGDFTVTHNTEMAMHLIGECEQKGKRALFVVDRISLLDQTSERMDKYGIRHGVVQGGHWRWRPWDRVQLASIQTIARRGWPEADLVVVDEAHALYKTVTDKLGARKVVTIGLSATPFTRGLGRHYDSVVCSTTTNLLIKNGYLSPYEMYAPVEPDMTGAKEVAGEWTDEAAAERSMKIVGDCVAEYLARGGGQKMIVFGCTVQHCREMERQFKSAGILASTYSYKTPDDEREEMLREFRKPNSAIRVLISVAALARGFDVPDVGVVMMARPLKEGLTEFIQTLGRGLRKDPANPTKKCTVLDLAGNSMRFYGPMADFFEYGLDKLDDGKRRKAVSKKSGDEKERARKCPRCAFVQPPLPTCGCCGYEWPVRKQYHHSPGELQKVQMKPGEPDTRERYFGELLWVARQRGYKDGWASYLYRERFGTWPSRAWLPAGPPSNAVLSYIRSHNIKFHKGKAKAGKTA